MILDDLERRKARAYGLTSVGKQSQPPKRITLLLWCTGVQHKDASWLQNPVDFLKALETKCKVVIAGKMVDDLVERANIKGGILKRQRISRALHKRCNLFAIAKPLPSLIDHTIIVFEARDGLNLA